MEQTGKVKLNKALGLIAEAMDLTDNSREWETLNHIYGMLMIKMEAFE